MFDIYINYDDKVDKIAGLTLLDNGKKFSDIVNR